MDSADQVNFATVFSNGPSSDPTSLILKELINLINYAIFAGMAAVGAGPILAPIGTLIAGAVESVGPFIPSSDPR